MGNYYLMHKDSPCAALILDEEDWKIRYASIIDQPLAPFNGNATNELLKKWWAQRAVPSARQFAIDVMRRNGYLTSEEYLAKNFAVSVSDTYWIRPASLDIRWDDVSSSNWSRYNDGKVPYHNASSYDPNASLSGQMEKYWDLSGEHPVLVKTAYRMYGQQSINEGFATDLHIRQNTDIPFVKYTIRKKDGGGITCSCPAFTSEKLEFLSAYEILNGIKGRKETSLYDLYIDICAQHGIAEKEICDFMDYQVMTDFLISNTDEHLNNFGILRDTSDLQFVSPAPIFDSGNSMFFSDEVCRSYKRHELLELEITAFHSKEEKMLSHVKNKKLIDFDALPSDSEVEEFYTKHGLPEERAAAIAASFCCKTELLRDFTAGMKISAYLEKKKVKEENSRLK